jgi:hypothetical protein
LRSAGRQVSGERPSSLDAFILKGRHINHSGRSEDCQQRRHDQVEGTCELMRSHRLDIKGRQDFGEDRLEGIAGSSRRAARACAAAPSKGPGAGGR